MWNTNQLTKMLNIKYPIIQAGMAGNTTPQLVASVSNNGGLGTIGAGYFNTNQLEEEIDRVRELTKNVFGVNIFVPSHQSYSSSQIENMNAWLKPYRRALHLEEPVVKITEEQQFKCHIDTIIEKQVPVCFFTFGIPSENIINRLKEANIRLVGTATCVDEAIANEKAGMDAIVAQGSEAGGHRGSFLKTQNQVPMIGTISLVPQVVDAVAIPVIAAGGIMDGRGILASIILGAQGVQMGTAFLTSQDSKASKLLRDAIINSKETDTVVTKVFSGKLARGINNRFIEEMSQFEGDIPDYPIQNELTSSIRKAAANIGDKELTHMWSGQSPRLATTHPANTIMSNLINQINQIIQYK
ncbi:NAD(P)H-dependent flavin oxidoreductase [Staphylococcus schweitzeri]|uniref:NAD(P)H-dependent flavin oxidoreductase n=1 Tax=Staphylococcus schweitzeri TaxID=1654388 RepID=UPI000503AA76|nr:nitronate monooxygenase family protein [Staphylococcus schweitzeri]CDR23479.1 2-nitropropane dioxygenase [Staphylococcus schweitzeri]CDR52311.1 2-nitropropane dioxygenase [Staphylococcus schweitzeri]CDR65756.1 2-nitropropane dioxygenase [Staphylococcus schweitzeri]